MLTTHVKPLSHLLRALHAPCGSRLPCLSTGNQNHPKPIWDMLTSCREQTGVISFNIVDLYTCLYIYAWFYSQIQRIRRMLMLHGLTFIVQSLGCKFNIPNATLSQRSWLGTMSLHGVPMSFFASLALQIKGLVFRNFRANVWPPCCWITCTQHLVEPIR